MFAGISLSNSRYKSVDWFLIFEVKALRYKNRTLLILHGERKFRIPSYLFNIVN